MENNANVEFAEFEIVIQHEGPVSVSVFEDALSWVKASVQHANFHDIERIAGLIAEANLNAENDIARQFYDSARTEFEKRVDQLVWLDGVESGSSVLKGRYVKGGKWLFIWFVGNIAGDVLGKQDWYKDLVDAIDKGSQQVIEQAVEGINSRSSLPDGDRVEVEVTGDRIRVIVHPRQRHDEMNLSPPPKK